MNLLVKFIAVDNVARIADNIIYINEIFKKIYDSGLIKNIAMSLDEVTSGASPVKELDDEGNTFLIEYNSEEMGKTDNWNIIFKYGTYNDSKQLEVAIYSDTYTVDKDNNYLEKLKLTIKKVIITDLKDIIWLIDKDSECLSIELYSKVYKTENLMRELINEVMIKQYGTSWWESFVPFNIKEKHGKRLKDYKSKVPAFNNVDERLMSIDVDDLGELITLKRYKWIPKYEEKINYLLNGVQKYNGNVIRELLEKQRTIEIDLWKDQFSKVLPEDFYERFTLFSKDRNHIMHNKLIDRSAYTLMKDLADEIENNLTQAIIKQSKMMLSDEEKVEIEKQKQIELDMLEALEHECKENDANVSIKSYDEIKELFENSIFEFLNDIEENLRFRSDIEIVRNHHASWDESGDLLSVTSKVDGAQLLFTYDMSIVDEEGAGSELNIYCSGENGNFVTSVVYTNGAVEYDSDSGLYMSVTQDEISNIETAIEETEEFINDEIANYRENVEVEDIAEFVLCSECGEDAICINEDILPIGTCMNCGYVNGIHKCEKCMGWVNSDEEDYNDEIAICQNCIDTLDEE